jgi:hypothetical protein
MTIKTIFCELVAQKEEPGGYEVLVFQDLEDKQYLMCTKLPNWNTKTPNLNDIGYLQAREFIGGQDTWYNTSTGKQIPYCYTGVYFWNFIQKEEKVRYEIKLD